MNAEKPFDPTAFADTVIRSSDGVHFYVLGAFLRYVSPTFCDLFSLNRGSSVGENETINGYPVVPLTEDSDSIRDLLGLIYPYINKPQLDDTRVFIKVGKMAEKYGMDTIIGKLKKRLNRDKWMDKKPLKVFVIAVLLGWNEETIAVAQKIASWEQAPYCEEFKMISGADYYRLLEFRFRREREDLWNSGFGAREQQPVENSASPASGRNEEQSSVSQSRTNSGDAAEPFHSSAKADIVLRSSDSIDFYISRTLLQLVSPTFGDLFIDPKEKESKNGLHVVCITEDSETLRYFLLMIYHHIDEPPMENLGLLMGLCIAARKYGVSSIEARLKKQLTASSSLVEEPFRVYAIATALHWLDLAKVAAENTLNTPLQDAVTRVPELNYITGTELHRLVEYRTRCAIAACKVIKNNRFHQGFTPLKFPSYKRSTNFRKACISEDVSRALSTSQAEIRLKACPRGATYANVFASEFRSSVELRGEHYLTVSTAYETFKCCGEVVNAIEGAIAKVSLVDPLEEPVVKPVLNFVFS